MMNPNIKKQWLDALRSGDYKQGHGALKIQFEGTSVSELCCLGVLCELAVQANVIPPAVRYHGGETFNYQGCGDILPHVVQVWSGLKAANGDRVAINSHVAPLSQLNDNGYTFAQLADAIEEQL